MFAEPQSIKVGAATATPLNRRLTGTDLGQFVSEDGKLRLELRTVPTATRTKHTMRLAFEKTFEDNNGSPATAGGTVTLDINRPKAGFTGEELTDLSAALLAWATASTNANLAKALRGEN